MMDSIKDYAFNFGYIDVMAFKRKKNYQKKNSAKLNHVKKQYRHLG
jgi:hypothetical protein